MLAADTPLGGGVVLGCHYQVLQKPWLPLDTAVRQFKVHLSLMATKARLHQQQQQHAGPGTDQHAQPSQQLQSQLQPQAQQQQVFVQPQQVSVQPQQQLQQLPQPRAPPEQLQQARPLEQPLLVREPSDSSSNPSSQLLPVPGGLDQHQQQQQQAVSLSMPALPTALLHVTCDDEYSDSSLGPGTPRGTSTADLLPQQVLQQRQRVDLQGYKENVC